MAGCLYGDHQIVAGARKIDIVSINIRKLDLVGAGVICFDDFDVSKRP
jgi:hypothetical protein